MNAGGLAQMSYNDYHQNGSLGTPSAGFASRGKGAHMKRLSVAPPASIGTINENDMGNVSTPRTSRSHLLAGLRTAPRTASGVPNSAPFNQIQHQYGGRSSQNVPQTATASQFDGRANYQSQGQYSNNFANHGLSSPDQILAPSLNLAGDEEMDPQFYNELVATNKYLNQRQQELQQQLLQMTQQYQNMGFSGQQMYNANNQMSMGNGLYNQQMQQNMQPTVQPVPNHPGYYSVFNPMTGQSSIVFDDTQQSQNNAVNHDYDQYKQQGGYGVQRNNSVSPPSAATAANGRNRNWSPPKQSPSPPRDVEPLPEPSANAYRPGHRKSLSSVNSLKANNSVSEPLKSAGLKSAGAPVTPNTGTFGLGLGRAGEHPVRQPRGPPPLEELVSKPTSQVEGSKNFATRQRRRALFSLVKAGNERRGGRGGSSGEVTTPSSEGEMSFPCSSSDGESDGAGSGSMTAYSSRGSLNGFDMGANKQQEKENTQPSEKTYAAHIASASIAKEDNLGGNGNNERRRMPMLLLTSAEKRKSGFA